MLPFCVKTMLGTVTHYGSFLADPSGLKVIHHEGVSDETNPIDAEVEAVLIPWTKITGLRLEKGLFGASFLVDLTDAREASQLPFLDGTTIEVTVLKQDRDRVKPFLQDASRCRSGQSDSDTDQFIDEMRDFLWDL